MTSPFADQRIFNQATFTFRGVNSIQEKTNIRGQQIVNGEEVGVTFKIRPNGANVESLLPRKGNTAYQETYEGRVTSGDLLMPKNIYPGDIGEGEINGRRCSATILDVQQSSVNPAIASVIGEKVLLSVTYRSGNAVSA